MTADSGPGCAARGKASRRRTARAGSISRPGARCWPVCEPRGLACPVRIDSKAGLAARALDGSDHEVFSSADVQLEALVALLTDTLRASSAHCNALDS